MPKDFPAIRPECVNGAKLYANRCQMIKALGVPHGGQIAEIGVARGDFSDFLIEELNPGRFYAIDLFDLEKHPVVWGQPQEVVLKARRITTSTRTDLPTSASA
jgi:hypothetical protein